MAVLNNPYLLEMFMDKEILNLPQHIVEESTLADKISWFIETNVMHKKIKRRTSYFF